MSEQVLTITDYHNWHQLTYPSFGNDDTKWENELDDIIRCLMVKPQ